MANILRLLFCVTVAYGALVEEEMNALRDDSCEGECTLSLLQLLCQNWRFPLTIWFSWFQLDSVVARVPCQRCWVVRCSKCLSKRHKRNITPSTSASNSLGQVKLWNKISWSRFRLLYVDSTRFRCGSDGFSRCNKQELPFEDERLWTGGGWLH